MAQPPRPFSTSAGASPNFLPHMRPQRRSPVKWLTPLVAVSVVGLAAKTFYFDPVMQQRTAALQAREREDADRRRQHEAFMDQYGDRSDLSALENAVKYYEKK